MEALEEYYKTLRLDIETQMLTMENGGNKTQLFTSYAIELMKMIGEVDNVKVAYDEETNPNRKKHMINAFSVSEDFSTACLFVTIYKAQKSMVAVSDKEIQDAIKLVSNFYSKATQEDYVTKLTDSAEIVGCAEILGKNEKFRENIKLVKIYVLTNGLFSGSFHSDKKLCGLPLNCEVFDLNKLNQISEEMKQPITVDLESLNYKLPYLQGAEDNDLYQAYVTIVKGSLLADLYKIYKVRLMESNVRQFLQFSGKVYGRAA